MGKIDSTVSRIIERNRTNVLHLLFIFIITDPSLTYVIRVNDVPIARIGHNEPALTTPRDKPICGSNRAPISPAGDADVRVVLLRTVNVIGECIVHGDVIELRSRLVVLCRPRFAAVGGNAGTPVIRISNPIRILRINPKTMVISMSRWQQIESFAAIHRTKQPGVYEINRVHGFRISVNLTEIPGPLTKAAVIIYSSPMLSGVIGTVKAAFLRLDDCISAVRIGSRNGNTDLAEDSSRKPISFQMFPGDTIIVGAIQSAARTTAGEKPWLPSRLPK